jgi:hypothetical protein
MTGLWKEHGCPFQVCNVLAKVLFSIIIRFLSALVEEPPFDWLFLIGGYQSWSLESWADCKAAYWEMVWGCTVRWFECLLYIIVCIVRSMNVMLVWCSVHPRDRVTWTGADVIQSFHLIELDGDCHLRWWHHLPRGVLRSRLPWRKF